jgi:tRNA threonylcarbamoyladenosine biosynthesis protein TsaB
LLRDETPLDERTFARDGVFAAARLLLDQASIPATEISLFAVGIGPGSFTGIRAGIAAVKGMAFPRGTPIKAISSFDALALTAAPQIPPDCPQMCVLGDARRDEVYYALYDRQGRPVRPCQLGAVETVADEIHQPLWFVSSEIDRFALRLRESFGGFASTCDHPIFPSAAAVGWLALQRFRAGDTRRDDPIEPIYLREPQYQKLS